MSTTITRLPEMRLPALKLVQSSRTAWRLANGLLLLLAAAIVAMLFVPWQQSARGTGKVVAYVPQERQQTLTAPVEGVVEEVAPGLREGMAIREGDFILSIAPTAANLRDQLNQQVQALQDKIRTAQTKAEVYGRNVEDFEAAREAIVKAADEMIQAARYKWEAEQKLMAGYEAKELQARLNYDRQRGLTIQGFKPEVELEKMKKDWDVAQSDLSSQKEKIDAAREEYAAKQNERTQKDREAKTKVDYATAMQQDALGQIATVQKELRDLEIKLGELQRNVIRSPKNGTIFRLPVFEKGQALKKGDALFTIIPEATERIVELWVTGNDMPLVRKGDHVRLQFEGWPAVQFAGWPSVAVGTFGGQVAAIDPTDDGKGKFRIQIREDDASGWPSDRFLRQGVRANGWVMLSQVSLGYEIWRQLNGFPPVISPDEPDGEMKSEKRKVPLPK